MFFLHEEFSLTFGYKLFIVLTIVYPLSTTTILTKCSKDEDPLCNSRGLCQATSGSYSCSCLSGWTGDLCDTNTTSKPQCMPGYLGDICNTSLCGNGSVVNNKTYFECVCGRGWTHESRNGTCKNVNECKVHSNICKHNGTCVDTEGSYKCNCTPAWTGFNCTRKINTSNQCTDCEDYTDTSPIIIGCVIGSLLLISLIGAVIYMNKRSRTNEAKDTVSNEKFKRHQSQTATDTQSRTTTSTTQKETNDTIHQ